LQQICVSRPSFRFLDPSRYLFGRPALFLSLSFEYFPSELDSFLRLPIFPVYFLSDCNSVSSLLLPSLFEPGFLSFPFPLRRTDHKIFEELGLVLLEEERNPRLPKLEINMWMQRFPRFPIEVTAPPFFHSLPRPCERNDSYRRLFPYRRSFRRHYLLAVVLLPFL